MSSTMRTWRPRDLEVEVLEDAHHAGRIGGRAVARHGHEVEGHGTLDAPRQVGHEEHGALEHADEQELLALVVARDLGGDLVDAAGQLLAADEDFGDGVAHASSCDHVQGTDCTFVHDEGLRNPAGRAAAATGEADPRRGAVDVEHDGAAGAGPAARARRPESGPPWSRRPGRPGRSARRGAGDAATTRAGAAARPAKPSPARAAARSKTAPGSRARRTQRPQNGTPRPAARAASELVPRRRRRADVRRRGRAGDEQPALADGLEAAAEAQRGRRPGRAARASSASTTRRSTSASPPSASLARSCSTRARRAGGSARESGDVHDGDAGAAPRSAATRRRASRHDRGQHVGLGGGLQRRGRQRLGEARVERLEPRHDLVAQHVARVARPWRWSRRRRRRCRRRAQYARISAAPDAQQRPRHVAVARPHPREAARARVLRQPVQHRLRLVVAVVTGDDGEAALARPRPHVRTDSAGRAPAPGSRRPRSGCSRRTHVQRHAGRRAGALHDARGRGPTGRRARR